MKNPKIAVNIPAFNEEKTIAQVIKQVPRTIPGVKKVSVIVIDDGSSDRTGDLARGVGGADKVARHTVNRGLGVAFRTGLEEALKLGADIIVTMDADGQFDPKDIPRLIQPIMEDKADVVTCSRFKDRAMVPKMPWVKKFGNSVFTKIVSFLTGKKFTDTQCGFRAYSREAALRATLFGKFTYSQEVLLDLSQKGMVIEEVACRVRGQREGQSKIVSHWYSYGAKALLIIMRAVRDYSPLKFFGIPGGIIFGAGLVTGLFMAAYWLLYTQTYPYTSLISVSALLLTIGFLMMAVALLADLSGRQRKIQEEILYRIKKKEFGNGKST